MKIFLATLGTIALQFLSMMLVIVVVAFALWVLLPAAFPAYALTFGNALGLSGLMYVAKAVFN